MTCTANMRAIDNRTLFMNENSGEPHLSEDDSTLVFSASLAESPSQLYLLDQSTLTYATSNGPRHSERNAAATTALLQYLQELQNSIEGIEGVPAQLLIQAQEVRHKLEASKLSQESWPFVNSALQQLRATLPKPANELSELIHLVQVKLDTQTKAEQDLEDLTSEIDEEMLLVSPT